MNACGTGNVVIRSWKNNITFTNCLHLPDLTHNLVSLSQLYSTGYQVHNSGNEKFTVIRDRINLLNGYISNGVFVLKANVAKSLSPSVFVTQSPSSHDAMLLHRRLGHLNFGYIKNLNSHLSFPVSLLCNTHCLPFPGHIPSPANKLDVIHSDLSGQIPPPAAVRATNSN